ncbi:IclR family transcriptional regulator [Paenalcaligenes sp. Me131]|uniref:IclR family transcriptional regulator n=1 Tax=Paenalcaligenes sp. Me131 TaxID=3392636 RepID=UPI003D2947A1
MSQDKQSNLFVQSVAKSMNLLEAFGQNPGVLSLNELVDFTGLDRSAVQRMAYTLVALGYMERGVGGRGYRLGTKCLDLSFDFLRGHPLIERASPILIDLQNETGERVDLSLFDDLSIIYALRRQTKRQTFFSGLNGRRLPTFCTSGGRAVMSCLAPDEVDDILQRSSLEPLTPKTITDADIIREKVNAARTDGYSLALEESVLGEIVLASAIVNRKGRPIGAVHISGSRAEWSEPEFVQRFAPLAISAARSLRG